MICAVSLWKSSHACSDGANVRDSTVANRFNAYFCDCFFFFFGTILLYGTFVGLAVSAAFRARAPACVLLRCVEAPQSSVDCHRVFIHGIII